MGDVQTQLVITKWWFLNIGYTESCIDQAQDKQLDLPNAKKNDVEISAKTLQIVYILFRRNKVIDIELSFISELDEWQTSGLSGKNVR